jgi:hypothetical protein
MLNTPSPTDPLAYQKWLDEILPLAEGAALRKTTSETLLREYRQERIELIKISQRRFGIRRREALAISETSSSQSAQPGTAISAPRTAKHAREIIQGLIDRGYLRRVSDSLLVEAEQLASPRPAELRLE